MDTEDAAREHIANLRIGAYTDLSYCRGEIEDAFLAGVEFQKKEQEAKDD